MKKSLSINVITTAGLFISSLLFGLSVLAQPTEKVRHRVWLTGNTADIPEEKRSQFNGALRKLLSATSAPFTLVINGDLIRGNLAGAPSPSDSVALRQLLEATAGRSNGKVVLLAGDLDWADSGKDGWKMVKRLEKLVASFGLEHVVWAIGKGCPGPRIIPLDETLSLITINTQWWNHPYDKPSPTDADCKIATEDDFLEALEDVLDQSPGQDLLIAGHFPVLSLGERGGRIPLKTHLFPLTDLNPSLWVPLPLLGSFYAAYRQNEGSARDLANARYAPFRDKLQRVIANQNSLLYLSAHEYNLQIIRQDNNYFLNSGSPVGVDFAGHDQSALFSQAIPGLIEITYGENGQTNARVQALEGNGEFRPVKEVLLYQSACGEQKKNVPVNLGYQPCKTVAQPAPMEGNVGKELDFVGFASLAGGNHPGNTSRIASEQYQAGSLKTLFFGHHYRSAWGTEIQAPYLNLATTFGGLHPLQKGGGRQTKSLKLMADNGQQYVFRSVDKDPVKALDYQLRETVLANVLRDQTTTQHPYGALATNELMNRLNILHPHPKLYVLPPDDRLGAFRSDYAGMLGMLEENPKEGEKGQKGFAGADKVIRSYQLFRELYRDPNSRVDAAEYALVRAFDIWVGDWGRHPDNWKWAGYRQGQSTVYRPVPRDRDHAFSLWDGLLPWLADREWAKPSGENFGYRIRDVRSLTLPARHLDRLLAAELDKAAWLKVVDTLQAAMTDELIHRAVQQMPSEVYQNSGAVIEAKLKARRKDLDKYLLEFYHLLAREVDVVGSNKEEYFDVIRHPDGSVEVSVYPLDSGRADGKGEPRLYHRTFYPSESRELRLFGLGGADVFSVSGESRRSIRLRLIGGEGKDIVRDASAVASPGRQTRIYEKSRPSRIEAGKEGKLMHPANPLAYDFERTAFASNTYFPLALIGFNANDGLFVNGGVSFTRHRYGKQPYSSQHHLSGKVSTIGIRTASYTGRWHHILGRWDAQLAGQLAIPYNFTYFFGWETIRTKRSTRNIIAHATTPGRFRPA